MDTRVRRAHINMSQLNFQLVLFVHREEAGIYAYGNRVAYLCDDNYIVTDAVPTKAALVNDYPHRYPCFKQGDWFYGGYRGNNRIYVMQGFKIQEYCQLQNLFPYCIAPLGDSLLVTDGKGKSYLQIVDGKQFRVSIQSPVPVDDVFLHYFNQHTYLLNRERCHLYEIDKSLTLTPVCIKDEKGYNQISFALDRFILIGKQNKSHCLIDVENRRTWELQGWNPDLEGNRVQRFFLNRQTVTQDFLELFGAECVQFYKQEEDYISLLGLLRPQEKSSTQKKLPRLFRDPMGATGNDEVDRSVSQPVRQEDSLQVRRSPGMKNNYNDSGEGGEGGGKKTLEMEELIAYLERKFKETNAKIDKRCDTQQRQLDNLQKTVQKLQQQIETLAQKPK